MRVEKGTLVYIPANVRLVKEALEDDDTYFVKDYIVTKKPVHCLVVGVSKTTPTRKYRVIYEGASWTVKSGDVFEINEEK